MLWHRCYSPVLWQCCYSAVTLLLQSCDSAVTVLWHCCYSAVKPLLQFCNSAVKLSLQSLDSSVTLLWQSCDSVFTVLWQSCDTVVTVLWQCWDTVVTVLWQCCDTSLQKCDMFLNPWPLTAVTLLGSAGTLVLYPYHKAVFNTVLTPLQQFCGSTKNVQWHSFTPLPGPCDRTATEPHYMVVKPPWLPSCPCDSYSAISLLWHPCDIDVTFL